MPCCCWISGDFTPPCAGWRIGCWWQPRGWLPLARRRALALLSSDVGDLLGLTSCGGGFGGVSGNSEAEDVVGAAGGCRCRRWQLCLRSAKYPRGGADHVRAASPPHPFQTVFTLFINPLATQFKRCKSRRQKSAFLFWLGFLAAPDDARNV